MKFTVPLSDTRAVVFEEPSIESYCPTCGCPRPRSGPMSMRLMDGERSVAEAPVPASLTHWNAKEHAEKFAREIAEAVARKAAQ